VFPMQYKLANEQRKDSTALSEFKTDLRSALDDRFALSDVASASHHFVIASVPHPGTKACVRLPDTLQRAAYDHIGQLTEAAAVQQDQAVDNNMETADVTSEPPRKRLKKEHDTCKVSVKYTGFDPSTEMRMGPSRRSSINT